MSFIGYAVRWYTIFTACSTRALSLVPKYETARQTCNTPTTPSADQLSSDTVTITHPFHPWHGKTFPCQKGVTTGNVPLIRCITEDSTLRCLPIAWTSFRAVDDFERVSAGRAWFRMDDLIMLRSLVDQLLDDYK